MNARILLAVAALSFVTGCAARKIPGTQIDDTDETRALLALMDSYRNAVEGRDAQALTKLVAPNFRDDGGTPTPEDDLTAANIQEALTARFARIDDVSLTLDVRTVKIEGNRAGAVYYYTLRFTTPGVTVRNQSASDLKRMAFEKVDGQWRIASGI